MLFYVMLYAVDIKK